MLFVLYLELQLSYCYNSIALALGTLSVSQNILKYVRKTKFTFNLIIIIKTAEDEYDI